MYYLKLYLCTLVDMETSDPNQEIAPWDRFGMVEEDQPCGTCVLFFRAFMRPVPRAP